MINFTTVTVITESGEISAVKPSFKAVKEALQGAFLEPVRLTDGSCLLVDEDGLMKHLGLNVKASHMAGQPIVGAVAWVPKNLVKKVLG